MFWDKFLELCESKNMKVNPVGKEIGLSSGLLTKWKQAAEAGENPLPTVEKLIDIADYFYCSTDYLLGRTDVKEIRRVEEPTRSLDAQRLAELYDGGDEMTVATFKTLLAMDEQARATILSTLRMFAKNANNAADAVTATSEPPSGARSSTKKSPSARRETGRKAIVGEAAAGNPITHPSAASNWQTYCRVMTNVLNGRDPRQPIRKKTAKENSSGDGVGDGNEIVFQCRMHDLRHTYATMLFESGVSFKDAQYFLGHANIKMTMELYTHLTEERKKESMSKVSEHLDKWLEKNTEKQP
jgi:transcriptional regulator with XRE-family HTH domain